MSYQKIMHYPYELTKCHVERCFFQHTGNEASDELRAIAAKVAGLEATANELANIRATLLVNFSQRNKYGFTITDEGSTLSLLMTVLEKLIERP